LIARESPVPMRRQLGGEISAYLAYATTWWAKRLGSYASARGEAVREGADVRGLSVGAPQVAEVAVIAGVAALLSCHELADVLLRWSPLDMPRLGTCLEEG
jgi:hypothetical protein